MPSTPPTSSAVRAWIVDYVSSALNMRKEDISTVASFDSYGFDSVESVVMAGVMEEAFNIEIDPNIFFDDFSIQGIVMALEAARLILPDAPPGGSGEGASSV